MKRRIAKKIVKGLVCEQYRNWKKSTRLRAIDQFSNLYYRCLIEIARREVAKREKLIDDVCVYIPDEDIERVARRRIEG